MMKLGVRTYRISVKIKETHGDKLERLQTNIRCECGRKPKICELIELAIESLESSDSLGEYYIIKESYITKNNL